MGCAKLSRSARRRTGRRGRTLRNAVPKRGYKTRLRRVSPISGAPRRRRGRRRMRVYSPTFRRRSSIRRRTRSTAPCRTPSAIRATSNIRFPAPRSISRLRGASAWARTRESARLAQAAFDDSNLRALFDIARDSAPQDIQMAIDLLKRFKRTNPDG